jgi:Family of unknown function (DUF6098)
MAAMSDDLPTLRTLDELAELLDDRCDLYVRWSRGPRYDTATTSSDELTGVPLPGLSANPLAVEDWWAGRSLRLWVARRLYDYRHLSEIRGPGVRPWVLEGHEVARGPDNEPLVACERPIAWLDEDVVREALRLIDEQDEEWGPLRRR